MSFNKQYFPNFFQSVFLCLLLIFFSVLVSFFLSGIIDSNNSVLMIWMNIPIFLVVFIIGSLWSGKSVDFFIKNEKVQNRFYIPIIFSSIGAIILIGELTNLLFYFYPIPENIINEFKFILSNKWGVIAAICVAAITEESLFRGMILVGLNKNYNEKISIALSSLLFGLIHVIPWQVVPAFFAGLFLGWIYLRFKSIILCIFIHALNNALAAIPEYYNFEIPGMVYDINKGVQFQPVWINIIGLIMFLYGVKKINNL